MKFKKLLSVAILLASALGVNAQTENIIANWDGGSNTGKPTTFGWASSNTGRSWNNLNVNSGARVTNTYKDYTKEDGSSYTYVADSEPSTQILWIRYNNTSETYTYTFSGLEAGKAYRFSGLVGWHNNSGAPTFAITVNGDKELAKVSKYCGTKQRLYSFSVDFYVPSNNLSEEFTLKFNSNQGGDNMEALSGLSIVEVAEFANASESTPYDMTSWLKNPGFESGSNSENTVNAPTDWKVTHNLSGWLDGNPKTTNPSEGSKCYNIWAGNVTSIDINQTLYLPAGKYNVYADLRVDNTENINDQGVYASVNGFVTKSGTITNVASPWDSKEGWNTLSATFNNGSDGDVIIGISSTGTGSGSAGWFQVDNVRLMYLGEINDDEKLDVAKKTLEAKIEEATTITTNETNVGIGAFQIPTSAVEILNNAIEEAQNAYNNASTIADVEGATNTLNEAITAYKNAKLNGPTGNTRYTLTLTDEKFTHRNKAATFIVNGQTEAQGLYGVQYYAPANGNYNQSVEFIPVEGETNQYYLKFTDNEGHDRYICDGSVTGAGTGVYGIRTTAEKANALPIKVIASDIQGVNYLWNTKANQYLGSNGDSGLYTDPKYTHFSIEEAQQAKVDLNSDGGFYTLMLPFAAGLPDGMKAYTCTGVDGYELELTEATSFAPNTPYIVEGGEGKHTFSGYGLATKDSYEGGLLTGVYAGTKVPAGSYVLQKKDGNVKFYLVSEGENMQPTLNPYRAYLTVDNAPGVKAFSFGGETTGINGVETLTDGTVESIYTINGTRVNSLQKGMNIVKMSNGKTLKVLVK